MATPPTILNDGQYLQAAATDADGAVVASLGANVTEGLQYYVIDEVVDLTAAGAKFVALTNTIPAKSVILAVSANVEELAVAGGTSVKIGIGPNGTDPDKYGFTGALTKNTKLSTILADVVLSSAEQIDVCAVTTAGSALGDSNFTAGKVRVRIAYKKLIDLADAG